jgi:hypothetical protein
MTILNTERACKRNSTETCESVSTWYQLAPGGGSSKSSRRGWNVSYGSGIRIWWVQLGMVTECTKNGCHMVKQRVERCMQLHWCTRLNTARNRPLNLGCYILLTVDLGQIFACSLAQSQPSSRFFITYILSGWHVGLTKVRLIFELSSCYCVIIVHALTPIMRSRRPILAHALAIPPGAHRGVLLFGRWNTAPSGARTRRCIGFAGYDIRSLFMFL